MTTAPPFLTALEAATTRSIAANQDEVRAAVLVLAHGAREFFPTAARIELSQSDQGEWLWVDSIDGQDVKLWVDSIGGRGDLAGDPVTAEIADAFNEFEGHYGHAATCMYLHYLTASPYLHDANNGTYFIDINEAVGQPVTTPPAAVDFENLTEDQTESLDELVHDLASQTASNTINAGQQVNYLLAHGWNLSEIEGRIK